MNITNRYNKEEKAIIKLNEKILKLEYENETLRKKVVESIHIEKELNNAKEYIKQLNKEKIELMEKQNEEIRKYKTEMQKLLTEKDFQQLNYNKRLIIFEQKIGKVNELEKENKVYKEELLDLKEMNKKLEEEKNNKIKEIEIKNEIKFKKIKNKIMNNLSETKDNLLKLSYDHFDLKTQLIYLQNNKLINDIDSQNKDTKKLIEEKNKLKIKILDLENQNNINEKIQLHLTNKLNTSKNNTNIDLNLFNKKFKKHQKKFFNLKKNFLNENNNNNKFLDSKIFDINNNNKKSSDKKINILKNKSTNNTLSKMDLNSISIKERNKDDSYIIERPKFKYKEIVEKKNFEIENLKSKLDSLKNRIAFFINKYKKLYNFLEQCLNEFFSELKEENNYKINYDELIKLNFSELNKKEKYGVLILLMNYLLPLITFNFNSNCNLGKNIFKTNINIFDKNFNKTEKHLNDDILKKSFFGKNNKLQKDLFIKTNVLFDGTIPVLRKKDISSYDTNNKIKNDKFKLVI